MSEAEILAELSSRVELSLISIHWWVSISFAVMLATYWGASRLTKGVVGIIIGMYTIATTVSFNAIANTRLMIQGSYDSLRVLSESTQLSPLGLTALEISARDSFTRPLVGGFMVIAFLFTISFVVYSYKYIKELE